MTQNKEINFETLDIVTGGATSSHRPVVKINIIDRSKPMGGDFKIALADKSARPFKGIYNPWAASQGDPEGGPF